MTRVSIANTEINDVFGNLLKIPERDEAGDVLWEDRESSTPKTVIATPNGIVREILLSMNSLEFMRRLQKPNDSFLAHRLWNQIISSERKPYLRLKDKEYEWITNLLLRTIPVQKDLKDDGVEARTVVSQLYGMNEWLVRNALKSLEDQDKDEPDIDDDDVEELAPTSKNSKNSKIDAVATRVDGG